MRAPRALARSYSSSTRIPAPSPSTKPSRSLSHGREATVGSSLRVDIAFIAQKPPTEVGEEPRSAPPAIITSASPYWIIRIAMPIEWLDVAQADTAEKLGPLVPVSSDTCPASLLIMVLGTLNATNSRGPPP